MRSNDVQSWKQARQMLWDHILFFSRERRAYTVSQELARDKKACSGNFFQVSHYLIVTDYKLSLTGAADAIAEYTTAIPAYRAR